MAAVLRVNSTTSGSSLGSSWRIAQGGVLNLTKPASPATHPDYCGVMVTLMSSVTGG